MRPKRKLISTKSFFEKIIMSKYKSITAKMSKERRLEFLQNLPSGKKFSASELSAVCAKFSLAAPVEYLIAKGEECNWLTSNADSFQSAETFANTFNGVYCYEQQRIKNASQGAPIKQYAPTQGDLFQIAP